MASYPDGNGSGAGANGAAHHPATSVSPHSLSLPPSTAQQHPPYDASTASPAAIAVAGTHHGLHALQAATLEGSTPSTTSPGPTASVYPPLASPSEHSDQAFAPRNGLPPKAGSAAARQTRLRRACDMCSNRKVKCDESGPPCKPCESLGVECRFERRAKRRGPPNKHAEAAKAAKHSRLDHNVLSSPLNAAETLVSMGSDEAGQRPLDAESIAPMSLLGLFVDDFFTYIHPLAPFPHEPTFRQAFANREDQSSPEFLALLASMVGMLVASFPRSARTHLKEQHSTQLYPRAIALIERCRLIAIQARGVHFANREEATVNEAATSYFLALAAGYTFQFKLFRRFMAEAMSFIQEMGHHRRRDPGQQPSAIEMMYAPAPRPINHIEDQIGKRIFWTMILGIRSMTQLGASPFEIAFPPPTEANPYPDRPTEADDECIFDDQIMAQPPGTVSLLTGFNRGIDVYMTMNTLTSVEFAYGVTQLPWVEQRNLLRDCVQAVKATTMDLPHELSLELGSSAAAGAADGGGLRVFSAEYFEDLPGYQYYPPGFDVPQENDLRLVLQDQPARRRQIQFDGQKANIYTSQLATRSYFVELYLNLRDAARDKGQLGYAMRANGADVKAETSTSIAAAAIQAAAAASAEAPDAIDDAMAAERELIVRDLLDVLGAIPQRNMEPNGSALINKIRQVASTLLQDAPERKGPLAKKAEADLGRFLEILMRLEKTGGSTAVTGEAGSGGEMTPDDEDAELRSWADLREYQHRFAQSGGFLQQ